MSTTEQALLPTIGPSRRLTTAIGRRWLRLRYLLTQRHRYDHLVIEHIDNHPFVILPQVFNSALFQSGVVLTKPLPNPSPTGRGLLDMGTGCGIGAVFAAERGYRVVAVDINPHAVRCARINALLNGVEDRVEVREGDLFAPVAGERFDLILFNPPFFRGTPHEPLDHAWRSLDTVERFAAGLGDHLTPTGVARVVLSTDGETAAFLEAFQRNNLDITIVSRENTINETLTVYQLRPKGEAQDADSL